MLLAVQLLSRFVRLVLGGIRQVTAQRVNVYASECISQCAGNGMAMLWQGWCDSPAKRLALHTTCSSTLLQRQGKASRTPRAQDALGHIVHITLHIALEITQALAQAVCVLLDVLPSLIEAR